MSMVKNYSDFTLTPWDQVWEKNILEINNVLAFARAWQRKQDKKIKKR